MVDRVIQSLRIYVVAAVGADRPAAHYLSGPKAMVDRFRSDLTARFSVPSARVLIDAWD
ncbi:hypothetical protein MYX84_01225 [Acidobacteria bacterium AH-259-O06]|nr:hypothetical protein [Acidobacteria bacterium AH-259-O06]